jgi:transposase
MLDQSYSIAEASRSLNVGENALKRWIKQLSEERGGTTPKSKAPAPESSEFKS